MNQQECTHKKLLRGSIIAQQDFYTFCYDCNMRWDDHGKRWEMQEALHTCDNCNFQEGCKRPREKGKQCPDKYAGDSRRWERSG